MRRPINLVSQFTDEKQAKHDSGTFLGRYILLEQLRIEHKAPEFLSSVHSTILFLYSCLNTIRISNKNQLFRFNKV